MEYDGNHVILKNPSWWERRSNLERQMMVLTFFLFLATIALIIGIVVILFREQEEDYGYYEFNNNYEPAPLRDCRNCVQDREPICLEPGCIHAASNVLKYMDPFVNPCDDFYHFSCGGFLNETNIPADLVTVDSFTFNINLLKEQLRIVVEERTQQKDLKPFTLVKKLYQKCMDLPAIEQQGVDRLKTVLRSVGGWPVLDGYQWNEKQFDWVQTVLKFRRAGLNENYFLNLSLTLDSHNFTRYILQIEQPDLGMEGEFLANGLEDDKVNAYFSYMVDVATLVGAELPFALEELKAVLEFEIALARISFNQDDDMWNTTNMYHSMKISELQRRYPHIIWLDYINRVIDLSDFKINFEDRIIVRAPEFLTEFEKLIRWAPKRIQANYIMWRAVKASVPFLPTRFTDRENDYLRTVHNKTEFSLRWDECVFTVSTKLPFAMGSLYVHKYIQEQDKEVVYDMVGNIREQFIELLRGVEWMDESTRIVALDKVESMTLYTAFSDELLSAQRLQKHYTQCDCIKEDYLSTILSIDLFERDNYYRRLKQYVTSPDWNFHEYLVQVRPDYTPYENKLSIPNAILRGMFFGTDRPQYLNYGGLGYIVAHEIAHGFDDTGRQYTKDGHYADWWTEHTKRSFIRKAQCISSQYRNYTAQQHTQYANGMTRHEANIANQGGLKAAYYAYLALSDRDGREYHLPSINRFTPQQLFWVTAAQTHCKKYRSDLLRQTGFTEEKTPAYFDVHETFSNIDYFARDFGCQLGSTMNPVQKCHVW